MLRLALAGSSPEQVPVLINFGHCQSLIDYAFDFFLSIILPLLDHWMVNMLALFDSCQTDPFLRAGSREWEVQSEVGLELRIVVVLWCWTLQGPR